MKLSKVLTLRVALMSGVCLLVGAPAYGQTFDTVASANPSSLRFNLPFGTDGIGNFSVGQVFVAPSAANVTGLRFTARVNSGGAFHYIASIRSWNGSAPGNVLFAQSNPTFLAAGNTEQQFAGMTPFQALTPSGAYFIQLDARNSGPGSVNVRSAPSNSGNAWRNYHGDGAFNGVWVAETSEDLGFQLTLVTLGPNAANTWLALQANSGAVRSVLSQRAAATTFALDYDCSVFDIYGFCVSVGARNSQIGNDFADTGETAGLLTAAYRVTQELRIGGFIDQNLVAQSPVGVDPKNTQPMLGAFAVYQENADFSGLTIRAALAYQEGDLRITRPELIDTQAGTGRARTSAFAFGGEIAYGFPLGGTWVAQPYAGLRRSDSQRRGYTETTSDSVDFPITYNRFGQVVTSATAGLRLRGAITPEFSLTFGAGMEHDLDSKMDRYSGTSTIPDLERFSINASQQQNETRAVGSAGMRYMIASNQALAFDASVRQLPYGNDPSITTMLRYSIGF